MGLRRLDLFLHPERELSEAELATCRDYVKKRGAREPVAYIIGRREFLGLDFRVSHDVLVPRPDTELLVEVAREFLKRECRAERRAKRATMFDLVKHPGEDGQGGSGGEGDATAKTDENPRAETGAAELDATRDPAPGAEAPAPMFADIGTGSGVIAICLAHELPALTGWATDLSEAALAVARDNAAHHGVDDRITFQQGNLLETLLIGHQAGHVAPLDLIVSNPPYVGENERADLGPELAYEPDLALFSGADGLGHVRRLVEQAAELLRPGGMLAMEIGYRQADDVEAMMLAAGWRDVKRHRDLGGHERVVTGLRL
jgi:release factor glutamine methyltransferase